MNERSTAETLVEARSEPVPAPFRAGAPNVVVIVLDDLGFAQLGCYGSDIDTPNMDRLAERGLRFTNFHTTAVCSPTRACLLTGRNHHRVGMGMLPDLPMNFPGYGSEFPPEAATLAQILGQEGWATHAIGKWHLTPRDQRDIGPYGMWPTGLGFDHYYGFLNGETNQWTPNLVRDNEHVEPPAPPEEGYHVEVDLADEAIGQLRRHRQGHADRPFLLYYATGAPHAPHQAPEEWIARYEGHFDGGWDRWREATLARQKELGVVPADVELSSRPEWVTPWDEVPADHQRLYARMMEVYAAFLSHADHHIGRVLEAIEAMGELDNTVVVMISDNGSSAEGGPHGTVNQIGHYLTDEPDDLDLELERIADLGGFRSHGHYPWGWALAGNTPLRRWKRYTFEGGIRDPLIVVPPGGVEDPGGLRHQYCHATDILPTVLEMVGVDPPAEVGGAAQMSLDGATLGPVVADATAPATRHTQYYECWGSRAIYHDGWKAVTNHVNKLLSNERELLVGSHDFAQDEWALFHTEVDFTESNDLATTHPDKLQALVELWYAEAERNQVFPLDDSRDNRVAHLHLPWMGMRARYDLRPGDKIHEVNGPLLAGGFTMTADFGEPLEGDAAGVLFEQGDWHLGWAWYLADREVRWVLADINGAHEVAAPLRPGARSLAVAATPVAGGGLDLRISADDEVVAEGRLTATVPMAWAPDGAFLTVGYGRPFPVSPSYAPPAAAPPTLRRVVIECQAPPPEDLRADVDRVMRHQ